MFQDPGTAQPAAPGALSASRAEIKVLFQPSASPITLACSLDLQTHNSTLFSPSFDVFGNSSHKPSRVLQALLQPSEFSHL